MIWGDALGFQANYVQGEEGNMCSDTSMERLEGKIRVCIGYGKVCWVHARLKWMSAMQENN